MATDVFYMATDVFVFTEWVACGITVVPCNNKHDRTETNHASKIPAECQLVQQFSKDNENYLLGKS